MLIQHRKHDIAAPRYVFFFQQVRAFLLKRLNTSLFRYPDKFGTHHDPASITDTLDILDRITSLMPGKSV